LPDDFRLHRHIGDMAANLAARHGFREMTPPVFEFTDVFSRTLGETSDVVTKEMYTFDDRGGDSITLRPEFTAGIARAFMSNGLAQEAPLKFFARGPVFRHERPQKGRYRQFHQFGVETYGIDGPDIDLEVILLSARLWKAFGIEKHVTLQVNSLGSNEARQAYRDTLIEYLKARADKLDEESLRRLETNPLRVLDSKNPDVQAAIADAPSLLDHLDEASKAHFDVLCERLTQAGIHFEVNPRLVRGLDYYNRTVFEWVTESLGAQGTVCAGGRYDGLVEQLGGKATPAVGFAMGIERLVLLLTTLNEDAQETSAADVYVTAMGDEAQGYAVQVAEHLRDTLPHVRVMMHCGGGNFKKQLKRADKTGAQIALLLGSQEMQARQVGVKPLRDGQEQQTVAFDDLSATLADLLAK
ncbi:MAG TPA: histidine--tRNA ligase, partial [Alteromonas australica]|nr:histidine--tRNA ligase [Alteromonas australica]